MAQPYLHTDQRHTFTLPSFRVTRGWALVFLLLIFLGSTPAIADSANQARSHISITKLPASSVSLDRSFLQVTGDSGSQDQICIQPQDQQQPYALQLESQHSAVNPGREQMITLHGNRGDTTGVQLDLVSNTTETAIACSDADAVLLRGTAAGSGEGSSVSEFYTATQHLILVIL